METILNVIAIAIGSVSLFSFIALVITWKSRVDNKLSILCDNCEKYPPAEIAMMAKTLWRVFMDDALARRPDLAEGHSAYRLKQEGKDLIPEDVKQTLGRVARNAHNEDDVASGYLVVKVLGFDRIRKLAGDKKLSIQETVAILSIFLDEKI